MFMTEDDLELFQNQLAYNLMVIKALWKNKWNNYGESGIRGHEYDFSSLYRSIEKGKETLRQYIQCNYSYKEKSMCGWANRIEAKTGIPHEYLTGRQRIVLGKQFEQRSYPIYTKYLHQKEAINKQIEEADNRYSDFGGSPEDRGNLPDFGTTEEIRQYVETHFEQKEQEEFHKRTKRIDATAKLFTLFTFGLAKESARIMATDTADLMQENDMLCRLVYFIRFRKKYDGIGIRTIGDMKTAMKETRTPQLRDLGKEGLREYIKMLEEHLNLARSVYTVAIDCGDFAPDKGREKNE